MKSGEEDVSGSRSKTEFGAAASEFLRAIRAHRSQVAFARRLGYRANPITDWENGRRYPTAVEALRACERTGIDVTAAFARFHTPVPLERAAGGFDVAGWLNAMRGARTVVALAEQTGHSRFAVARWLKGTATPRVPDFLALTDAITGGRVPELIAELVAIEEVPTLLPRYESARASRRLAFEEPWTEAVLRVLETRPYQESKKHEPGYIARMLSIPEEVEQRCLARLQRAGVIRRKRGLYRVIAELNVDTAARPEEVGALRAHWARVVAERAPHLQSDEAFGYNLVSLRADDLERVRGILRRAFREIRSLVAASEPEEAVAFVGMQMLRFEARDTDSSEEEPRR